MFSYTLISPVYPAVTRTCSSDKGHLLKDARDIGQRLVPSGPPTMLWGVHQGAIQPARPQNTTQHAARPQLEGHATAACRQPSLARCPAGVLAGLPGHAPVPQPWPLRPRTCPPGCCCVDGAASRQWGSCSRLRCRGGGRARCQLAHACSSNTCACSMQHGRQRSRAAARCAASAVGNRRVLGLPREVTPISPAASGLCPHRQKPPAQAQAQALHCAPERWHEVGAKMATVTMSPLAWKHSYEAFFSCRGGGAGRGTPRLGAVWACTASAGTGGTRRGLRPAGPGHAAVHVVQLPLGGLGGL